MARRACQTSRGDQPMRIFHRIGIGSELTSSKVYWS
jgi:hypothetical protein